MNRTGVRVITVLLTLIMTALYVGCNGSSSHKVAALLSPSGDVEAVLIEVNGGATTSFGYDVYLEPKGSHKTVKVASLYGATRNEQAYGVNMRWADNNLLQIQYFRAKAVSNVLNTAELNQKQVRVMLQNGIKDPNAPSGGMFFNLQKQSSVKR